MVEIRTRSTNHVKNSYLNALLSLALLRSQFIVLHFTVTTTCMDQVVRTISTISSPKTISRSSSPAPSLATRQLSSGDGSETRVIELVRLGHIAELKTYLMRVPQSSLAILTNATNFCKETPLLIAVCQRHLDCVRLLLSHHADPGKPLAFGNTVLHAAASVTSPLFFFDFLELLKEWERQSGGRLQDVLSQTNECGWSCLDVWLERSIQPHSGLTDLVAAQQQRLVQNKLINMGAQSGLSNRFPTIPELS